MSERSLRPSRTIALGARITFEFTVLPETMEAFAMASGDRHPLHWDAAYAQACGFEGPVVYGGLLVAQVSRLIGEELEVAHCVWNSLRIDFRYPLYVGQKAGLDAEVAALSEAVNIAKLKFTIATEARTIAAGSADVMVYE